VEVIREEEQLKEEQLEEEQLEEEQLKEEIIEMLEEQEKPENLEVLKNQEKQEIINNQEDNIFFYIILYKFYFSVFFCYKYINILK
jgi:hypothetical protein